MTIVSRLPAVGDQVIGKHGYMFDYEGMRGEVVRTDPPRHSQHKCAVKWEDGGEDYVLSSMLWNYGPASLSEDAKLVRTLTDAPSPEARDEALAAIHHRLNLDEPDTDIARAHIDAFVQNATNARPRGTKR